VHDISLEFVPIVLSRVVPPRWVLRLVLPLVRVLLPTRVRALPRVLFLQVGLGDVLDYATRSPSGPRARLRTRLGRRSLRGQIRGYGFRPVELQLGQRRYTCANARLGLWASGHGLDIEFHPYGVR
jgi:hypothetical protein